MAKQLKSIKTSLLSRSLSMAKLGLGAGTQLAGRSLAQLWENKDGRDEKWKMFFAGQAKAFSKEIGELKGSLMKAGQMLSMLGEHFFPPEVNQFLKSLQQDSPPIQWETIHKILLKEFGPEKLALLEIEHQSVASASLGQVHRAKVIATGEILALKIQYPGVEKAIDSDLKALKGFLSLTQVLPKDFNLDPLFQELREMLIQETDYVREAEMTRRFYELLKDDSRYVVPRVNEEFSNKKILATSFEQGLRADDPLVSALSQDRRNRLAESFLDLYFHEIFAWGLVQTDPHIGNYRIRLRPNGEDQIVLLDFGATREYHSEFLASYRRMIKASVTDSREAFHAAARELNFLQDNDDPKLQQMFEDFCKMIVEPFRHEVYDWKKTDLPQRTTQMAYGIIRGFKWRSPPREILFLDRKSGGVFIMLSVLRARIQGRQLLMKYFD